MPRGARMKWREALDLSADLRRSVQQEPALAVSAHGDGFLRPTARADLRFTNAAAIRASAIPLRESSPRRGPEHADLHLEIQKHHSPAFRRCRSEGLWTATREPRIRTRCR